MKEQIQVPFDSRDSAEKDQDKPKGLSRPTIAQGLERPKAKAKAWLRRRCNCGNWGCASPGTGQPPGYYWEYFDIDGHQINAKEEGLPLIGDEYGSASGGWRLDATSDEMDTFYESLGRR